MKSKKNQCRSIKFGAECANETRFEMCDIQRGLIYTHNRVNKNTAEVHRANAAVQTLIEVLMEKDILNDDTWSARLEQKSKNLRTRYVQQGMAVAMQEFKVSKYEFKSTAAVDCENRSHLCKAVCCKLPLALSKEDVQEGTIQWELSQPYMIAHNGDDYCVHHDPKTCFCNLYENRPIPCRGYDCSKDKRIWLNFPDKVVNPAIHEPGWVERMAEIKALAAFGKK